MKRALIQLQDSLHASLRRRAYEQGTSIAGLVREAVRAYLNSGSVKSRPASHERLKHLSFIASGRSSQGRLSPVSERHDEALEKAFRH